MRILVTGGSACGKSTFAESLASALPAPRFYIATMRPYDGECVAKIARHREQREGRGFVTVERDRALSSLTLLKRGTVLLECLCNLTANEMFDIVTFEERDPFGDVMAGVDALERQCNDVIVVTNEVGCGTSGAYSASTQRYVDTLGRLNRALASRFECVIELVCGIPVVHKGALPGCVSMEQKGGENGMTLVIGGASSGKRDYVLSLGYDERDIADGVIDGRAVVYDLQDIVDRDPDSAESLFEPLLQKAVVVCDEVGGGVIPSDPHGRNVRERTGRLCNRLAREAGRVVRMVCGIPVVIK